jgi:hypothetical protein
MYELYGCLVCMDMDMDTAWVSRGGLFIYLISHVSKMAVASAWEEAIIEWWWCREPRY